MVNVFVSYTATDEHWAEWIAWQLEGAGHTTVIQAWDFGPGHHFVGKMHDAIEEADRVVAVLSPAYLASPFCEAEWMAAFRRDPNGAKGILVPARVAVVEPTGLLAGCVYVDLVGADEATCRGRLLDALPPTDGEGSGAAAPPDGGRRARRPARPPRFPGPDPHAALDLELTVEADGAGGHRVRARAPDGEEAAAAMPVAVHPLLADLARIQDAVLASSAVVRRAGPRSERPVEDLGRRLFDALMVDRVRDLLRSSRETAAARGTRLRLVLRALPDELAALPWELLYDEDEGEHVCLTTPLVRSQRALDRRPSAVEPTLRVLGMVVSPRDQPALEVDDEQRHLEDAFADLVAAGKVQVHWLGPTWRELRDAMQRGPWHVFHFVGHGGEDARSGQGTIVVADDDGRSHPIRADDLANLLRVHDPLRLVLLNACGTGRGPAADPSSGVATTLARRGVPAVVAMQLEITDQAAVEFTRSFYGALTSQLPVDLAVTHARQAISLALPGTLEWATPVLYLQAADGYLFDIAGEPQIATMATAAVDGEPAGAAATATEDRGASDPLAARYAEALAASGQGRWTDAVTLFGQVVAEDRTYRDAVLRLEDAWRRQLLATRHAAAVAAADDGRWSDAVHELEALRFLDPDFVDVEDRLAAARRQLADEEAASEQDARDHQARRQADEDERARQRADEEEQTRRRAAAEEQVRAGAQGARRRGGEPRGRRGRPVLVAATVAVVALVGAGGWSLSRSGGGSGGLGDDFDGASVDPARWAVRSIGSVQGDVVQDGGLARFEVTTVGEGALALESTCRLTGDFDVRVAYALLEWPASSGARVGIVVAGAGESDGGAVERLSEGEGQLAGERYATHIADHLDTRPTDDRAGELRLTRVGDVMTGYARPDPGAPWEEVASRRTGDSSDPLRLQVWGRSIGPVVVAMDDFAADGPCR